MADHKRFVRDAFAAIAPRYDLLNTLLSFGVERLWRKKAVKLLAPAGGKRILDLCAGTFTLSRQILDSAGPETRIVSVDFCMEMLLLGTRRLSPEERPRIRGVCGDAESIPLRSGTCNRALVSYGIRNLNDAAEGLREIFRILEPGGGLVILDFLRPRNALVGLLYAFYLKRILPLVGGIISGDLRAYRHLANSIEAFMEQETLVRLLEETGFSEVKVKRLTFGIAGLFHCFKPLEDQ